MPAIAFALLTYNAWIQTPQGLVELGRAYGLEVQALAEPMDRKIAGYRLEAEPVAAADLERYTPLFTKEWNRYPQALMKNARVTRIVIVTRLKLDGQARAAVPSFETDTMYYDANLGSHSPNYQRVVIHHEFFHMIDQRMGLLRKDPEWKALNSPGFAYGHGGIKMRAQGVGNLDEKLEGVLTPYSAAAIEEDKAELFAHSLVNPDFVEKRLWSDPVLGAKRALLRKRLEAFEPELNKEFWERVRLEKEMRGALWSAPG